MKHGSDNDHRTQLVAADNTPPRPWIGNTVRGLLLVANICVGGLVAIVGMIGVGDPGPWGLHWPMIVELVLWSVLALWLVVSGILLVCQKRPKCWKVGSLTHAAAGLGFFMLVVAMRYEAEYIAAKYPGHMAMELRGAAGIIGFFLAILGAVWLAAAAVLYGFLWAERTSFRTEVQSPNNESHAPE